MKCFKPDAASARDRASAAPVPERMDTAERFARETCGNDRAHAAKEHDGTPDPNRHEIAQKRQDRQTDDSQRRESGNETEKAVGGAAHQKATAARVS